MRPSPVPVVAACWFLAALFAQSACAKEDAGEVAADASPELASTALSADSLKDTVGSPIEVHQVVVTLEEVAGEPNTPRHQKEKTRLLGTLKRGHGKWDSSHTRHRVLDALHGFSRYYQRQKQELIKVKELYKPVAKAQRALLEKHVEYSKKFNKVDHTLSENQLLCDRIVQDALKFYDIPEEELQNHIRDVEAAGRKAEKISVSQALKHIMRDWTEPGNHERAGPFECLLKTLEGMFPERDDADPVKILLPGAGLGRLGHDVAKLGGFEVDINEWSMYMNIAYRFVEANRARNSNAVVPFVDGWSHHRTEADMFRKISFPDVGINASSVLMIEGDFISVLNDKAGHYDVVLTYFFIDTARNLMTYFDTIKKVLKPSGHWINLGPLLYGTGPFVQLTLEEILVVTQEMGFEYLETPEFCGALTFPDKTVRTLEATYGFDELALTKHAYKGQFWIAKKN